MLAASGWYCPAYMKNGSPFGSTTRPCQYSLSSPTSSVSVSVPTTKMRLARAPVGNRTYTGARSSSDSLNVCVASLNSSAKTRRATSRVGAPLMLDRPRSDERVFGVRRPGQLLHLVHEEIPTHGRSGHAVVEAEGLLAHLLGDDGRVQRVHRHVLCFLEADAGQLLGGLLVEDDLVNVRAVV